MGFDIGVNVVEVDGATAPSVTGAAVSVAGLCVTTDRGVPGQPTRVTSFAQFVERFGGYRTGSMGAYLVKGFFDNGGQTAYVARIVDSVGTTPAKLAIKSGSAANDPVVLTVEGGFRGQPDPGSWARRLFARVAYGSSRTSRVRETAPAKLTGTTLTEPIDMSTAPPLRLEVDGALVEIPFQLGDFDNPAQVTAAGLASVVNGKTNDLEVTLEGTKLVLTSTGERAAKGSGFTSMKVVAANAPLGFATPAANPQLGQVAAFSKNTTTLADPAGFSVGDLIDIADGTNNGSARVTSVDPATGELTWSPDLANAAAFNDVRKVVVGTSVFDLLIARDKGDAEHVVETYRGLSMQDSLGNHVARVINNQVSGSRYVRVAAQPGAAKRPIETEWTPLSGGADATPTATHFIAGLTAFDPIDIQLLCCERTEYSVARQAIGYCEKRGDVMFVGAVPGGLDVDAAVGYGQKLSSAKGYAALYGPWIVVPDPAGVGDNPLLTVPPTGHVMGVYARTETTRGIWKAPAGDEASLRGALDVETRLSAADHTNLVVNGSVNGIRMVPRAGIVIDASRTTSGDPRWRYVNVRLLFNYVKSSLRDGLRWARQEPNRDALWTSVKYTTITPFLLGLWRQGAFGTGTAAQTFTVIVDATNNPPDQVEQGLLTAEVYFYPSRPAETIVVRVGQQASGATVAEG
ncbi:phage tail sheath family protein [Nocardia goodfellowii]|uniref:Phage tail sheath protein FI n=1 Tax=Nocardia goodfellowii TaxID=882446 RepID=A0ABS4QMP5_9NOCA|nr:phage tail sheath subtilisin-like domain-containing protein [Nocardia goodfellowii]MBP2192975.1 phage tail sheath protein FI [Nocardia goodfellowii]